MNFTKFISSPEFRNIFPHAAKGLAKYFFFFVVAVFAGSCKKDHQEAGVQTIRGSVFNLATGKNMQAITVNLVTKHSGNSTSVSCQSDGNGNFEFDNVKIQVSGDYEYMLLIESKSGIGNGPEIGFDGVEITVDKDKPAHFYILDVVPHFKSWSLYFPAGINLTINDTFKLELRQNTFHANVPGNSNYLLTVGDSPAHTPSSTNFIGTVGNYWMGWWYSTFDRTKNGVHIVKTDSFYIDWGEIKTDTIAW